MRQETNFIVNGRKEKNMDQEYSFPKIFPLKPFGKSIKLLEIALLNTKAGTHIKED